MEKELLAELTLSMMPEITPAILRSMSEKGIPASELTEGKTENVGRLLGLDFSRARLRNSIDEARIRSQAEIKFCIEHSIKILTPWNEAYPARLLETSDFPKRLFMLGNCNLNNPHPLAVIGTRKATSYGLSLTERTVRDLAPLPGLSILSGLALGIDAAAHRAALEARVPTVAVLAHGLSRLYPSQNRDLARAIIASGGALLTEYTSDTAPFRGNFLERNRIVAGMSDATLVVESPIKGGAMSTARIAFSIDRSVMAFPGRVTDPQSEGCNLLIRQNKGSLVTSTSDILTIMGCDITPGDTSPLPTLFPELEGEAARLYELLVRHGAPIPLDQLTAELGIPVGKLISLVSDMEFDGIVTRLPGNRVELS